MNSLAYLIYVQGVVAPEVELVPIEIIGSESFTKWLVWGARARDSAYTSVWELGKVRKFLHPHCLQVHKVQNVLPSSNILVFPSTHIVSTIDAAFLFEQSDNW